MASNGFGYYFSQALLDYVDLAYYAPFNQDHGAIIPNSSGNPDVTLKIYGNVSNFYSGYGSGYFNGSNIGELNSSGFLNNENFTSLIIFEKTKPGAQVLLSTIRSGVDGISGFDFGISDSNKFYISSPDETSRMRTVSYSLPVANKNGISLSKAGNFFSLSKFNFSEERFYREEVVLPYNLKVNSDALYLGNSSGTNSSGFVGFIDEFALINNNINNNSLNTLFKGFYRDSAFEGYGIIQNQYNYNFYNIYNSDGINFEAVDSGLLDYIQSSIFKYSGVGDIVSVTSGNIISSTAYVSGFISGYVIKPDPSEYVQSGQKLVGYASSGLYPAEIGITGYQYTPIKPFVTLDGESGSIDLYNTYSISGITGVTRWQVEYTDPIYETTYTSGVSSGSMENYYEYFNYSYSGPVTGSLSYVHIARFTSNGTNRIAISHDLTYSNSNFQPTPAKIYKNEYIEYGNTMLESEQDWDFKKTFSMDGIFIFETSGEQNELIIINKNNINNFNNYYSLDAFNSDFFEGSNVLPSFYLNSYFNGLAKFQDDEVKENSYLYSPPDVISLENWTREDLATYDIFENGGDIQQKINLNGGLSNLDIYPDNGNSYWFFNGLKLISGQDYTVSPGSIQIQTSQFEGISGDLWSIRSVSGLSTTKSNTSSINTISFSEKSSQVWKNRVRQNLGYDYVETSKNDPIFSIDNLKSENLQLIFITDDQ